MFFTQHNILIWSWAFFLWACCDAQTLRTPCPESQPMPSNCSNAEKGAPAYKEADTKSNGGAQNLILMIGDGMGLAHLSGAATVNKAPLHMFKFPHVGFVQTQSADSFVTDSAAAATAMATGKKTKNGFIGLDASSRPQKSIFHLAQKKGLSVGIVITSFATDATPAAFYAHNRDRYNWEKIAEDFADHPPDVYIGGGRKFLKNRSDNKNLLKTLTKQNVRVVTSQTELSRISKGKVAAFLYENKPPEYRNDRKNFLPDAVHKAISLLSQNPKGFLLLVEGAQIDWAGHNQDLAYGIEETLDFDRAVKEAFQFSIQNTETLLVVTADHETGGLTITNGNEKEGSIKGEFHHNVHTGVMVPLFAYGPHAQSFSGVYPNHTIYRKMKRALAL